MSLRFFIDHCVPNSVIQTLRDAGHTVFILKEHIQVRNHPQVIPPLMHRLINYLKSHTEMSSYKGQLLLVEAHRIRIRK